MTLGVNSNNESAQRFVEKELKNKHINGMINNMAKAIRKVPMTGWHPPEKLDCCVSCLSR